MADDDSSELSSLSSLSPAPSDDETVQLKTQNGILKFFHKLPKGKKPSEPVREPSPPPRKRSPSPPHEYVLADNPDIAFIVMFRCRFNEAFPKSMANFGPQELERDIIDSIPGERAEQFLCGVLGLLLNRKQDVKPGHYNRALEDAIQTHKSQWAKDWEDTSPLAGGATFNSMTPSERLTLLKTLILWSLSSSDAIKTAINQSYKQNRHEDDLNQPLSVQPWGSDSDKRRYFLIEGLDDTCFRVYRESNPAGFNRTWRSVAGSIDEVKALVEKLETKDGGPKARKLCQKMMQAVPRFEATEEKRKRREYRQIRKAQFKRPEPGFSMYEGRTRGKRIKYTYSDDDDEFYSDSTNRRSTRNTGTHTPADPAGPVTTMSGRQVRPPKGMNAEAAGSAAGSVQGDNSEDSHLHDESSVGPTGRPRRSAAVHHGTNGWAGKETRSRANSMDEMEEDEDASEPDFGDDEEEEHVPDETEEEEEEFEEDEAMDDEELEDKPLKTLIVKLPLKRSGLSNVTTADADESPESKGERAQRPSSEENDEISMVEMPDAPAAGRLRKERTPEAVINVARESKQPLTPSALQATSLAFRGSPDKPQSLPRPVGVGVGE